MCGVRGRACGATRARARLLPAARPIVAPVPLQPARHPSCYPPFSRLAPAALKSYLTDKFGKAPQEVDAMIGIADDFDYVS